MGLYDVVVFHLQINEVGPWAGCGHLVESGPVIKVGLARSGSENQRSGSGRDWVYSHKTTTEKDAAEALLVVATPRTARTSVSEGWPRLNSPTGASAV